MDALIDSLLQEGRDYSALELTAVVTAILYLLLAIRQHIACWVFALISAAIYVYLFIDARLYMQSVLNGFYFGMAVFGWYSWRAGGNKSADLPVSSWSLPIHVQAVGAIIAIAAVNGFLLERYTDATLSFLDSLTAWAAIWTTFLVARKVLQNWWYWLVIDVTLVFVYWQNDLHLTSLLFVVYVLLIPFGLFSWTRSYRKTTNAGASVT